MSAKVWGTVGGPELNVIETVTQMQQTSESRTAKSASFMTSFGPSSSGLGGIHVLFRTFRREETLLQGMDLTMIDNEKGSSRFHDCR